MYRFSEKGQGHLHACGGGEGVGWGEGLVAFRMSKFDDSKQTK